MRVPARGPGSDGLPGGPAALQRRMESSFQEENAMRKLLYIARPLACIVLICTPAFAAGDAAGGLTAPAMADSIPPDHTDMRDISSYALSQEMVPG